ncbi:Alpha/Beta hydrolase protein [Lasiosphaeria ovina]|uniref:GPI inositol-deacylase n=1 Tax=Lasiosphaeria ovina TaxID=92902 RepID=A0AAE0JWQ6_9PEZI|nr:Alpha/Beta hydrolase protein [Lasiosphaeria ovina]
MDTNRDARDGDGGGNLHPLHTPAATVPDQIDIIAVHGLNGHYLNTWTATETAAKRRFSLWRGGAEVESTSTLWLRDLLPQKLPNAHVLSFEYDATAFGNKSAFGVRENSMALLAAVRDMREDHGDQARPIIFIGHSLGGIVIKQALTFATHSETKWKGIVESTKGVVFFGTPHRGADAARWGHTIADIVSTATHRPPATFLKTLETNSAQLLQISEDFRPSVDRYAIASFYEQHAHPALGTVVVDKLSALLWLPNEEANMMSGDHSAMCKFAKGDRRFDRVWRTIKRVSRGRE